MEQPPLEAVAAVESADEQLPQHTNSPSRDLVVLAPFWLYVLGYYALTRPPFSDEL